MNEHEHAEGALVRFPRKQRAWLAQAPMPDDRLVPDRLASTGEVFVWLDVRVLRERMGSAGRHRVAHWTRLLSLHDGRVWWTTLSRNLERA